MNPEIRKTLLFAGSAVVLALLTALTGWRPAAPKELLEQGKPFYEKFADPLKATALEIVDFDELTGSPRPFKVELAGGRWSIPSHHNYPADAKDRLAKTAKSVIDLRKELFRSDRKQDHEAMGVVDPLDADAPGTKGRGRRVRLFDTGGTILADYVFGKDAGEGKKYVRVPGENKTWAVKTEAEFSAKFEDWVETDLLQLASSAIRRIVIDKYSFDEGSGELKNRSTHVLARDDSGAAWKLNELKEETEEVNTENVNSLVWALDDLKIAGVRAKPGLIAKAKDLNDLAKLPRPEIMAIAQELQRRGFFVFTDKQGKTFNIVCNEGEMAVSCDDGIVYSLRFGEVLLGNELVSSGAEEPKKKDEKKDDKKDEKKDEAKPGEHRYLFVSARFDESFIPAVPAEPKPYAADPAKKPEEQKADEEKAKKEKDDWEQKKKDREKKLEDGKKRADQLTRRFAEYYYVISGDAFKKLRLDRTQLVKAKEKKPEEKKEEKKPDEKNPEPPKPEDKKPDPPKPDEKKPEAPKPEEKKP
jgi:hypothetical protein